MMKIIQQDLKKLILNLQELFNEKKYQEMEIVAREIILLADLGIGWKALGVSLRMQQKTKESIIALEKALIKLPNDYETYNNLGNSYKEIKENEKAILNYNKALSINNNYENALLNIAILKFEDNKIDQAEIYYNKILLKNPKNIGALFGVANIKLNNKQYKEAISIYKDIVIENNLHVGAYNNLALSYKYIGAIDDAKNIFNKVIEIDKYNIDANNNLGVIACNNGEYIDSLKYFQNAVKNEINKPDPYANMASAYKDLGELNEAEELLRKAIQINKNFKISYDNLLFLINYHPYKTIEEIYEDYKNYGEIFKAKSTDIIENKNKENSNSKECINKIKIGYLSGNFSNHSIANFLLPIIESHDREKFYLIAISTNRNRDKLTNRYEELFDRYEDISNIDDQAAANLINDIGIDVLIDLSGHTEGNRLGIFAFKPAKVSISYFIGFAYTTGLKEIDYYLTDEILVKNTEEIYFSEKIVRINTPAFVYRPSNEIGEVSELPALKNGYITFGTLSRSVRINERVIKIWSEIIKKIPNSKLIINSRNFKNKNVIDKWILKFQNEGVCKERLEIGFDSPVSNVYSKIDIALDCFPHNSGTTLVEGIYMGVPFITLSERVSVGRIGEDILKSIGLENLIAYTEEQYVQKTIDLAINLIELNKLRKNIRFKLLNSKLMNEKEFILSYENKIIEIIKEL
jgi:protein O-GlcNAc transferase